MYLFNIFFKFRCRCFNKCTGIRLGTAAVTTRGFNTEMSNQLGKIIAKILLKQDSYPVTDLEIEVLLTTVGDFYK